MIQHIDLPDNIANYIDKYDGINLSININNAGAFNGLAHMSWYTVSISMLTRTCHRCGYDLIWKPDDSESLCNRHSYGEYRYDDVFIWSAFNNDLNLEQAFDKWIESQPKGYCAPVKKMIFGQFGWR